MKKNEFKMKLSISAVTIMIYSFCGAIFLSFFSCFQKMALGLNPFVLKGYIVPVLFGATTGAVIGKYITHVRKLNFQLIELNSQLKSRIEDLENFLPMCSNCKKVRKPNCDPYREDSWITIESYISDRTSIQISHGLCPKCMKRLYGDLFNGDEKRDG